MTTFAQVQALVDAHASQDEERFRKTVTQIAAHMGAARSRQLLTLLNGKQRTLVPLPVSGGVLYEALPNDIDLSLPKELCDELDEIVREWESAGMLLAAGLHPRRRLLFWGPPGNGKSTAATQLAHRLGLNAYICSLPAVIDSYMGASAKNVEKAFTALNRGSALILDEIDALGSERSAATGAGERESNRTVSSLLTLLDQSSTSGLLVATTNRKDFLDPALVRRFDECLEFPGPTPEQLAAFVEKQFEKFGIDGGTPLEELRNPCFHNQWCSSYDEATKAVVKAARYAIVRSA